MNVPDQWLIVSDELYRHMNGTIVAISIPRRDDIFPFEAFDLFRAILHWMWRHTVPLITIFSPTPGMMSIKTGSLMVIQMGNENLIGVNTLLIIWSLRNTQCNNHQCCVLKPQWAAFNWCTHVSAHYFFLMLNRPFSWKGCLEVCVKSCPKTW